MSFELFPKQQKIPAGHPSQERRDLCPNDAILRRHGYQIWERPKKGETIWRLGGRAYTESEALVMCGEKAS